MTDLDPKALRSAALAFLYYPARPSEALPEHEQSLPSLTEAIDVAITAYRDERRKQGIVEFPIAHVVRLQAEAVEARVEREACALVAEAYASNHDYNISMVTARVSAAIRARGTPPPEHIAVTHKPRRRRGWRSGPEKG